jgi:hypothetical protein
MEQSAANKAQKEGKEWKVKAIAAGSAIRKAVTPTSNMDVALAVTGGAGKVAGKLASRAGKAQQAAKEAAKFSKAKVAEEAVNKELIAHRGKTGYMTTTRTGKGDNNLLKSARNKRYPSEIDDINELRNKDLNRKAGVELEGPRHTTEEFTSRGKKVGKRIGDQGGSPSDYNAVKREGMNKDAGKISRKNQYKKDAPAREAHERYINGWNKKMRADGYRDVYNNPKTKVGEKSGQPIRQRVRVDDKKAKELQEKDKFNRFTMDADKVMKKHGKDWESTGVPGGKGKTRLKHNKDTKPAKILKRISDKRKARYKGLNQ